MYKRQGLYNRRGFDSVSLEKYKRAKKEKKSFVIFAIDMDNLKVVNDRFGHMNGDLALRTIGEAMQAVAGKEDACARVGGDEYNVVGIDVYKRQMLDITTIRQSENFYRKRIFQLWRMIPEKISAARLYLTRNVSYCIFRWLV